MQITINPVNDPPSASGQTVTTNEDNSVTIAVSGSDIEGDALAFSIVSPPRHGSLASLTSTGPASASFFYSPEDNFHGDDFFTFKVNDGFLDSIPATVSITVGPVNDPPSAAGESVATDEDAPVTMTLLGSDVDGDSLTFSVVDPPKHGSLGPTTLASVVYSPQSNFHGDDSFTFKVNDGSSDSSLATVNITVLAVNDPPQAAAETVATDEDAPVTITLTGTDVEGDGLAFSIVVAPQNGSVGPMTSTDATSASVLYSPQDNFHGDDLFTFVVNDGSSGSDPATVNVTVNPINDPPTASGHSLSTEDDTKVTIVLTARDVDGDQLTFSVVVPPQHGSLGTVTSTARATSTVGYTPNLHYRGSDSFTFKVTDGPSESSPASVDILVTDARFGVVVHTGSRPDTRYFLDQLGVNWYLNFSPDMTQVPAGTRKVPFIQVPAGPATWISGEAERVDELTDAELAALGFTTRDEIRRMAEASPGAHWYVFGEANRYGYMTGARFAPVLHLYAKQIRLADPSAKIVGTSILNWDFTCIGCPGLFACETVSHSGYQCGKVWLKQLIQAYETRYTKKPPVDIWAIDVYPLDWVNTPNSAVHASVAISQLEGMRQYLDTIPEYVDTPIWITEVAVHVGYETDFFSNPLVPVSDYQYDKMSDYLLTLLDWLEANADANYIEKWFFYRTWKDIVNVGGDGYMGIIFFGEPVLGAPFPPPAVGTPLNCLGEAYRARALHYLDQPPPRVKCDPNGNTIPE